LIRVGGISVIVCARTTRRAGRKPRRAESREQRAENREQRAESREQRTENREERRESREQRTENKEKRKVATRYLYKVVGDKKRNFGALWRTLWKEYRVMLS
jgi:flagellar biosynthesis/type III secretory pathway M-ring protein FliF/YscJ